MIDIHDAHHAATTWREFFIHIATIVLGLFIAIGLEQTVEYIHHRHQREQLEERLHQEFRADLRKDDVDIRIFRDIRAYMVQLKAAVTARRTGSSASASLRPTANDSRRQQIPTAPSVDAWEAARENATVALLPGKEIQLYSRIVIQHDLLFVALNDFQHSAFVLESFEERFVDSPGAFDLGDPAPLPNLNSLSSADLVEYESLLAAYIKSIDRFVARLHFFDREVRALLDGATDEEDLMRRAFPELYSRSHNPNARPDSP